MSDANDPSRRGFVFGTAALAVSAAAPGLLARTAAAEAQSSGLSELTAVQAVQRMSRGELSAESYAQALLGRCAEAHALNAFITLNPEQVLQDARTRDNERRAGRPCGPLFGLPIPVKDSVNTRDYPTTAGTPGLRHFRPAEDAPIVAALRGAGAIVLGKTNLHELSFGWTSNNLAFGAVHNPYDLARIPGGSSGGTAAAVAARLAPLGVAEDTEGSIRVPAALCGIAGFRPTTGRYSTEGCVPISPLFDQVGPHARDVNDLALFDAVASADHRPLVPTALAGVRFGVVRDYWFRGLDPEVERLMNAAMLRLTAAGAKIIDTRMAEVAELIATTTDQVQNHDVRVALPRYLARYRAGISFEALIAAASPDIRATFASDVLPGGANFVDEARYAAARDRDLPRLRRAYGDYFASNRLAAMIFPTTLVPAPVIGADSRVPIAGGTLPFEVAMARNIAPGSTAGVPGLVLPIGLTQSGLPVSMELDGPAGSDRDLLALGLSVQQIFASLPAPSEPFRRSSAG